jgi:hypothetical protein
MADRFITRVCSVILEPVGKWCWLGLPEVTLGSDVVTVVCRAGHRDGLLVVEEYHLLDYQKPVDVCLPCRGPEVQLPCVGMCVSRARAALPVGCNRCPVGAAGTGG